MYEITVIASSRTGEQSIKEVVVDGERRAKEIADEGAWSYDASGSFVFFPPQSITSIEALKLPELEEKMEAAKDAVLKEKPE